MTTSLSRFNPLGKPIGDPSCLQCALRTCVRGTHAAAPSQCDLDSILSQCTAFFADARACNDEDALAYHTRLFSNLMHDISHQGLPDGVTLMRLLDCGGRMLMAVKTIFPEGVPQQRYKYDNNVQILSAYARQQRDMTMAMDVSSEPLPPTSWLQTYAG